MFAAEAQKPSPHFAAGLGVALMPGAGTHTDPACLPSPGCLLPALLAGMCGQLLPTYV